MNKPDLSIIIGTYNTRDLTKMAIDSIIKQTKDVNLEIIVVDDASKDGTFELLKKSFPNIILIRNKINLRYCKTYNKGTRLAKGRYIIHLNSDVIFTKKTNLADILKYMDLHPKVGIIGCKVIKYNGKIDPPSRHQVPTLKNVIAQSIGLYKLFPFLKQYNYYMTYFKDNEIIEVGGVGPFMLFRREVMKDIGMVDENFHLYCQDSDFCFRTFKSGWKIIYYPKSEVIHLGGGTAPRFRIDNQLAFHKDMWYYYKKHFSSYPFFIKYIVYLGLKVRFFVFIILEAILYIKNKLLVSKYFRLL
jgi:GT2 family glycosyltransferase